MSEGDAKADDVASALLIYFSISGTTRRVAQRVAAGLEGGGVVVTLHDLRTGPAPDPAPFDLIGVGSPTHYFRLPVQVSDAVRGLGHLDGKLGFAFVLHGSYRGASLNVARRLLRHQGAVDIGSFASYGEDLYLGYLRKGLLFSAGHPTAPELDSAEAFGAGLAETYRARVAGAASPTTPPEDRDVGALYRIERLVMWPPLARGLYSRFFSADSGLCTRCGKCARTCPTGNISWTKGERPAWGRACTMCLTCASICPADAVRSPADWLAFEPLMRYNVRHAANDPGIEAVRITHQNGKNEILSADRPPAEDGAA